MRKNKKVTVGQRGYALLVVGCLHGGDHAVDSVLELTKIVYGHAVAGGYFRCGLFFNGCIHSAAPCREFFSYNRFYTTAASRIARSVFPDAVTVSELEKCISGGERR